MANEKSVNRVQPPEEWQSRPVVICEVEDSKEINIDNYVD